jgi:hypothetical protein
MPDLALPASAHPTLAAAGLEDIQTLIPMAWGKSVGLPADVFERPEVQAQMAVAAQALTTALHLVDQVLTKLGGDRDKQRAAAAEAVLAQGEKEGPKAGHAITWVRLLGKWVVELGPVAERLLSGHPGAEPSEERVRAAIERALVEVDRLHERVSEVGRQPRPTRPERASRRGEPRRIQTPADLQEATAPAAPEGATTSAGGGAVARPAVGHPAAPGDPPAMHTAAYCCAELKARLDQLTRSVMALNLRLQLVEQVVGELVGVMAEVAPHAAAGLWLNLAGGVAGIIGGLAGWGNGAFGAVSSALSGFLFALGAGLGLTDLALQQFVAEHLARVRQVLEDPSQTPEQKRQAVQAIFDQIESGPDAAAGRHRRDRPRTGGDRAGAQPFGMSLRAGAGTHLPAAEVRKRNVVDPWGGREVTAGLGVREWLDGSVTRTFDKLAETRGLPSNASDLEAWIAIVCSGMLHRALDG